MQQKKLESRIELIPEKRLVGIRTTMSLTDNTTAKLWRSFMPRRHEVKNRTSSDYISMQVYDGATVDMLSPTARFQKWATVEVSSFDVVPDGMEPYTLAGGAYAVFIHRGPASAAPKSMSYIFGVWLPESGYTLDDREHFEVLPDGYDPFDVNAHEEIWIPIR